MKTKILLLLCLISLSVNAQDNFLSIDPQWKIGDSKTYEIHQRLTIKDGVQSADGYEAMEKIKFTVTDTVKDGYKLDMKILEVTTPKKKVYMQEMYDALESLKMDLNPHIIVKKDGTWKLTDLHLLQYELAQAIERRYEKNSNALIMAKNIKALMARHTLRNCFNNIDLLFTLFNKPTLKGKSEFDDGSAHYNVTSSVNNLGLNHFMVTRSFEGVKDAKEFLNLTFYPDGWARHITAIRPYIIFNTRNSTIRITIDEIR